MDLPPSPWQRLLGALLQRCEYLAWQRARHERLPSLSSVAVTRVVGKRARCLRLSAAALEGRVPYEEGALSFRSHPIPTLLAPPHPAFLAWQARRLPAHARARRAHARLLAHAAPAPAARRRRLEGTA